MMRTKLVSFSYAAGGTISQDLTPPDGVLLGVHCRLRGTFTAIGATANEDPWINTVARLNISIPLPKGGYVSYDVRPKRMAWAGRWVSGQNLAKLLLTAAGSFDAFEIPFVPQNKFMKNPDMWGVPVTDQNRKITIRGTFGALTDHAVDTSAISSTLDIAFNYVPHTASRHPRQFLTYELNSFDASNDAAVTNREIVFDKNSFAAYMLVASQHDDSTLDRVNGLVKELTIRHGGNVLYDNDKWTFFRDTAFSQLELNDVQGNSISVSSAGTCGIILGDVTDPRKLLDLRRGSVSIDFDPVPASDTGITDVTPAANDLFDVVAVGVGVS